MTTFLTPSPYHLLDHEYGMTPQNQIIPNPLTSPLTKSQVSNPIKLFFIFSRNQFVSHFSLSILNSEFSEKGMFLDLTCVCPLMYT